VTNGPDEAFSEPTYPLTTARLVLRPLAAGDLDHHHRLFSDPRVVRYLYDSLMSREEAAASLERRVGSAFPAEGEWRNLAVEFDGEFVGEVGLCRTSIVHRQGEVGYVFDPRWSGRGLATEATARMVSFGFDALGLHRIAGRLDARNRASARVLERLGFRREATCVENEFVKGEWTDEIVYAVLEGEWSVEGASARSRHDT